MEIKNKKAYFNYFIAKEIEAGIELKGSEIKSLRKGECMVFIDKEHLLLKVESSEYERSIII